MKPAVDQQEGRLISRPLSCVHHNFGLLFDFSFPLTNLCPPIKYSVITPTARRTS
jgi:hypothetical protein